MKTALTTTMMLALALATGAQAAPRAQVRTVTMNSVWSWGPGPSKDFSSTLIEVVNDGLAACAAGQDLRLDVKIEKFNVRQAGDVTTTDSPNRLVAQVKVRQARDKSLVDLQRIEVETWDEGVMAYIRDPELIMAEATSEAICGTFFAKPLPAPV